MDLRFPASAVATPTLANDHLSSVTDKVILLPFITQTSLDMPVIFSLPFVSFQLMKNWVKYKNINMTYIIMKTFVNFRVHFCLRFYSSRITFLKRYGITDFRERGKERERNMETSMMRENHYLATSCTPSTRDHAYHLGMCPENQTVSYWPFLHHLWRCLFRSFACFIIGIVVFLLLSYKSSLYVLDTDPSWFSYSLGYLCIFMVMSIKA